MRSTSSRLSCWPSKLVMWARPALSRNASLQVSVVTPSRSFSSIVSTASTSGQQLKCHVSTVRTGGSTSRYVPLNENTVPSPVTKEEWYLPPTRKSIEHSVIRSGVVAPHLLTCSGLVNTSKTRTIGASNSRVMTTSSSFGNVMTAEPCRSGATVLSLSLQLFEVVLDPIQSVVDRPLVLGHPVMQGLELPRVQ